MKMRKATKLYTHLKVWILWYLNYVSIKKYGCKYVHVRTHTHGRLYIYSPEHTFISSVHWGNLGAMAPQKALNAPGIRVLVSDHFWLRKQGSLKGWLILELGLRDEPECKAELREGQRESGGHRRQPEGLTLSDRRQCERRNKQRP